MGFELTGQLVWAVHTATNIFDLIIIFFVLKIFFIFYFKLIYFLSFKSKFLIR